MCHKLFTHALPVPTVALPQCIITEKIRCLYISDNLILFASSKYNSLAAQFRKVLKCAKHFMLGPLLSTGGPSYT